MNNEESKIFGIRAIIEAIQSGKTIAKVYLQKGLGSHLIKEMNSLIKTHNIAYSYVPIEKLNRLSKNGNHQGVVAQISAIDFIELDELLLKTMDGPSTPLFLLLDRVSDVRNFGAIMRTAECTGVHGIIIQKQGNAPVNADAIKTSAGAAFNIPICKVDHIKDAVFQFKSADIQVVAATEKTNTLVYNIDFDKPTALIMGAEDRGIHPSVLKLADIKARLPLLGNIESLNVSVACGAFLYEATRQRLK